MYGELRAHTRSTVAKDGCMDILYLQYTSAFTLFLLVGDCGRSDDNYCIPGSLFA